MLNHFFQLIKILRDSFLKQSLCLLASFASTSVFFAFCFFEKVSAEQEEMRQEESKQEQLKQEQTVAGQYYFASMRMSGIYKLIPSFKDECTYEDAAKLNVYYHAFIDDNGRCVKFKKYAEGKLVLENYYAYYPAMGSKKTLLKSLKSTNDRGDEFFKIFDRQGKILSERSSLNQ